jgi:hypothetical protein
MWNQYNTTNLLESRMRYKEQRLKIGERERETRNRDVRLGTEDDKEQRSETWNRGWDTRNRDVRDGNKGWETRNSHLRQET